jgi:hypothetical protein
MAAQPALPDVLTVLAEPIVQTAQLLLDAMTFPCLTNAQAVDVALVQQTAQMISFKPALLVQPSVKTVSAEPHASHTMDVH